MTNIRKFRSVASQPPSGGDGPTVEQLSEQLTDEYRLHFAERCTSLEPGTEFSVLEYLTEMRRFDRQVSPLLQALLAATGRTERWLTPAQFYAAR